MFALWMWGHWYFLLLHTSDGLHAPVCLITNFKRGGLYREEAEASRKNRGNKCVYRYTSTNPAFHYSPPGKFFPPFLQMSLRGRSSRSNPRLQWETASFLAVTSHLDYWKKLFWTAISTCFPIYMPTCVRFPVYVFTCLHVYLQHGNSNRCRKGQ
jgi:hypothetical protein